MTNPFLIEGYAGPEYFCDRQEETATIEEALRNGRNLVLISPRRMGKTGLIQHLFHRLHGTGERVHTFYLDILPTQSLADFVSLLGKTVLGKLDATPKKMMARIGRFIKSVRPVLSVDSGSSVPQVSFDVAEDRQETTLKEIMDYLSSCEECCYIAIDEFQQIASYPEKGVEALLRSHIQFMPQVRWVFSGSSMHLLQQMFLSTQRPFYQSAQILTLAPIREDSYRLFAQSFFERKGQMLTAAAFQHLYHSLGGHTWYLQSVLNRLYATPGDINEDTIDKTIGTLVRENAYAYQTLMGLLPSASISLLRAIAQEGAVDAPTSSAFLTAHRLRAASTVSRALNTLMEKGFIYKSEEGYRLYDRFLERWIVTA